MVSVYFNNINIYIFLIKNIGSIPGTLRYKNKKMDFGGTIACIPSQAVLQSKVCKGFLLKFSTKYIGKFIEKIEFIIEESQEIIYFTFKYLYNNLSTITTL